MADGDVPGSGAAGSSGAADGSSNGDEAAWLDLVARFNEPFVLGEDTPWPEREHLADGGADDQDDPLGAVDPLLPHTLTGGERLVRPERLAGHDEDGALLSPDDESGEPAADGAEAPEPPWVGPSRYGPRDVTPAAGGASRPDPGDEHYVPPPPPPLPRIDPIAKGAWIALFGGPLYLLIATAAGWGVSGLAAFLAVAAFVSGFAILVFRMDNGGPGDSGPDDGAVV